MLARPLRRWAVAAAAGPGPRRSLVWVGWVAVRQWQQSLLLLADRQAEDASERFLAELTRDMQAVQRLVLLSPALDAFTSREPVPDPTYGAVNLVASAFARYSYPEAFFIWNRGRAAAGPVFFYRRDRPVSVEAAADAAPFPVIVDEHASVGAALLRRIQDEAAEGRRFVVFEMPLEGASYQVVARLLYRDVFRQNLETIFGFAVNLDWARQHYFPAVLDEAASAARAGEGVAISIADDRGQPVAGADAGGRVRGADQRPDVPVDVLQPGDCRRRSAREAAAPLVDGSGGDARRFLAAGRFCRRQPHAGARPGRRRDAGGRHRAERARRAGPAAPGGTARRFRRQRDPRVQDADRDHTRRRRNAGRATGSTGPRRGRTTPGSSSTNRGA